ncbi:ThuA domain-containing protein [Dactylosporangium aurantiacum]|uniref:ThuA domain-containing protein n=1 Tax=Dactylosporangium aurantiacum TaxID=35754 RepID=A0A9Q9IA77_9ACTN|nr:ThuA domain-containing protein [Dactylosporangium aurantiacum]MDG6106935.1 ThuA domain-containing protein [Dactylosporangium aurantiacum]UWZ50705.1 ThuA domain-containing protein [Dactylosporangium aurantiacum]
MSVVVVVRGGWEGHRPVEATDRYVSRLRGLGHEVVTSESLDTYLDAGLMGRADLVVHCWTMGTATEAQVDGLAAAVRAGTGLAGWHGGIVDSFRGSPDYQRVTGGQFVHHPADFVTYEVTPVGTHPVVAGIAPFTVHTERYQVHVDPAIEVHAVTVVDAVAVPVVWTTRYGAGRVFVTTVGHELKDLEVAEHDEIIMRGLAWASR